MELTKEKLAEILHGRNYLEETTRPIEIIAKENNLVICFGGRLDIIKFKGSVEELFEINEDIYFDKKLANFGFENEYPNHIKITCYENDCFWNYKANFPVATFDIFEGRDLYCKGLVFSLEDLK